MKSVTTGKLAAGIVGLAGAGSLGVTTTGVARIAIVHAASTKIWVVLALLPVTAAVVAGLSLVLDYESAKFALQMQVGVECLRADLERARLDAYLDLIEKSAGAAGTASSYRDLLLTDALHLAVERYSPWSSYQGHGRPDHPRIEADPPPEQDSKERSEDIRPEQDEGSGHSQ